MVEVRQDREWIAAGLKGSRAEEYREQRSRQHDAAEAGRVINEQQAQLRADLAARDDLPRGRRAPMGQEWGHLPQAVWEPCMGWGATTPPARGRSGGSRRGGSPSG